jgi:segregation and condensation protein A
MPDGAHHHVKLEVFEGPLDLLLTLIQRRSLDVTTVALAQVTEQYLAYLATLEEIDPGALAEFCRVAATLIVIKSRALLPAASGGPEEEEDADAEELAERLRAYRRFRGAADRLGSREKSGLRAFVRVAPPPDLPPRVEPGDVSAADLAAALRATLAESERRAPEPEVEVPGVRPHPVRLSTRLAAIRRLLDDRRRVSFREVLTGDRRDREFIIVSFLAVLELLRRRYVRCLQEELFGEIVLELRPEVEHLPVEDGVPDDAGA